MDGFVVKFEANRGFGFIRVDDGDDIFVHISNIDGKVPLEPGQKVTFDIGNSEKGPTALNVKPGMKRKSPFVIFFTLGCVFAAVLSFFVITYLKLSAAIAYLCGVNFSTFVLYGYDKLSAKSGKWLRVPEKILHLFTFLGGTPMAFVSQYIFRHKTIKGSFRIVFWIIFIVQIVIIWKLLPHLTGK